MSGKRFILGHDDETTQEICTICGKQYPVDIMTHSKEFREKCYTCRKGEKQ